MFRKHLMRFLSIIFMMVVSVGLISGIGASTNKIDSSLSDYYRAQNVSDYIIKATANKEEGFSEEDISTLRSVLGEDVLVDVGMSVDVTIEVNGELCTVRLYFLDFSAWTVNLPTLNEGMSAAQLAADGDETQMLCAASTDGLRGLSLGDEITLDFADILSCLAEQNGAPLSDTEFSMLDEMLPEETVSVAGIVQSPIAFAMDGEPSYIQEEGAEIPDTANALDSLNTLDYIFYLSNEVVPSYSDIIPALGDEKVLSVRGDLYVAIGDRDVFSSFSGEYEELVGEQMQKIEQALGEENIEIITLYDNYSFNSLHAYGEKVLGIGIILMVAFAFLTALVVLSNMTRLMEEERGQIACLKTLGYSGAIIITKYLLFLLIALAIGGVGSYFVGMGVSSFIYFAFGYSYVMPPMTSVMSSTFYLIALFAVALAAVVATVISGGKMTALSPASLLRPKPPKSGRKVVLEHIPALWNRISFKYKSTLRNVLRYRNRFFMTVLSVACSMALVLAGMALLDICVVQGFGSAAILGLSVLIVVFAGLLTVIVIYTLTGINISERNREIATLMVLGYHDREVTGYIYREIYITTAIGALLGYPLGVGLMELIFRTMNFGAVSAVSWYVWPVAIVLIALFTVVTTLILRHKIVGIDMNESLKAIE